MHHLWWGSWLFYLTKSSLFFWMMTSPSFEKGPKMLKIASLPSEGNTSGTCAEKKDAKRWLKPTFKPRPCESSWNHQPWPCRVGSSIELETPFWTFQTQNTLGRVLKWGFHQSWFSFIHVPYQEGPLKQTHRAEHSSGTHLPKRTCDQLSVTAHVLYAMHQHCANLHCPNEGSWQVTRVIEIFLTTWVNGFHAFQWMVPLIFCHIWIGQWQPASQTFDESKARSSAGRLAGEVHYRSVAPLGWWMWPLFF